MHTGVRVNKKKHCKENLHSVVFANDFEKRGNCGDGGIRASFHDDSASRFVPSHARMGW